MDKLRFKQVKKYLEDNKYPNLSNEKFSTFQKKEIIKILESNKKNKDLVITDSQKLKIDSIEKLLK